MAFSLAWWNVSTWQIVTGEKMTSELPWADTWVGLFTEEKVKDPESQLAGQGEGRGEWEL